MKDKGHFTTSLIKSCIRIGCGIWGLALLPDIVSSLEVFIGGFVIAEFFGLVEEFLDRR